MVLNAFSRGQDSFDDSDRLVGPDGTNRRLMSDSVVDSPSSR